MKKFMMIAAMMVAAVSAKAQFEPGTFSIQPKAGFSVTWLSNMEDISINLPGLGTVLDLEKTPIAGALLGVEAEYQLANKFSLAAGVNYSLQGSGWKDYEIKIAGETGKIEDSKIELGYVTIPVTANYYLFKGFAVKAGVQFGFMTNASFKATTKEKSDGSEVKTEYDEKWKDKFDKFDISIPMGVSYQFKVPIVLDLRYNLGLTKVNKESEDGHKDLKNNVIQLTVGYKFAL